MMLQDQIDQFKKFKQNNRISKSDDEEDESVNSYGERNISSSRGFKSKIKKMKTIHSMINKEKLGDSENF